MVSDGLDVIGGTPPRITGTVLPETMTGAAVIVCPSTVKMAPVKVDDPLVIAE